MAGKKKSSSWCACTLGRALAAILILASIPMMNYQLQLHNQPLQELPSDVLHKALSEAANQAARQEATIARYAKQMRQTGKEWKKKTKKDEAEALPVQKDQDQRQLSRPADAAGVQPAPELEKLVEKLNQAMRIYQRAYRGSMDGDASMPPGCDKGFSEPHEYSYLAGCPEGTGCKTFNTLEAAKAACLRTNSCGGIIGYNGRFEVRQGSLPMRSNAGERCWVRETCYKSPHAEDVWTTFRQTMDLALKDPTLHLDTEYGPPREDDSIFISISAYRDHSCRASVRKAYLRAANPELLHVGVVQQNCNEKCMQGVGWADTRHLEKQEDPDPDCIREFCESALGKPHCDAQRVRILRVSESEALGPLFARYLNAKLWRGENYFMQIDAHTNFRQDWDQLAIEMIKKTPSHPRSVMTNYPPSGTAESDQVWGRPSPEEVGKGGLCGLTFERVAEAPAPYTIRLGHGDPGDSLRGKQADSPPPYTGFIAAGFFFAHGLIVTEVPPDPFLPFIFMGEEIAITLRTWTSGFDIYTPTVDFVAHEYVRSHSIKFWESVGIVFDAPGLHNELTTVIMPRIQHLVGFPEAFKEEQVQPQDLLTRMKEFDVGKVRSREDFIRLHNIDLDNKVQRAPDWCLHGTASSAAVQKS